jgi:hypothetical protein
MTDQEFIKSFFRAKNFNSEESLEDMHYIIYGDYADKERLINLISIMLIDAHEDTVNDTLHHVITNL